MNNTIKPRRPVFWVLAGTADGRDLAGRLSSCECVVHVSVATTYGRWFIENKDNLIVHVDGMDKEEMITFIHVNAVECVIDATHPYAQVVTNNIRQACSEVQTRYIRLLRPASKHTGLIYADDIKQAAELVSEMPGKVLLTCGSKEIDHFTAIQDFQDRIYLRILPMADAVQKCLDLGFKAPHIICMQGPFSKEMNIAMLKDIGVEVLVTKDSGPAGGFGEKIEAAELLGISVIVIGRPPEIAGDAFEQVLERLSKEYSLVEHSRPDLAEPYFPCFISLKGKTVKVFGGGFIAARRVRTLLQFGVSIKVIAPEIKQELLHLPQIQTVKRRYQERDCEQADLVIAATNDSEVNRIIAKECKQLNIPVNVADNKELCTFYFPAVIRQDYMVIGITASGQDHHKVKRTADRIRSSLDKILD